MDFGVSEKVWGYFKMLEPEFPEWLNDYIDTPEMRRQRGISVTCGTIYSRMFPGEFALNSLEHSVGVALIIWHFTRDKKQALAGLFHDIATPAFKHCIDCMDGDYMRQETTEGMTREMIAGSAKIMELLKRDGIQLSEVDDYRKYPIADNETPRLSADRLEYSLSGAVFTYGALDFEEAREIYEDIEVQENEEGCPELGFRTKKIARKFVKATSELSVIYRGDEARFSMQFLADVMKRLSEEGVMRREDLYTLGEDEILKIIEGSKYREAFKTWREAKTVKVSNVRPEGMYYVHHGAKVRYIDPLFQGERMSAACKIAKKMIDKNLAYDMTGYVYLGFEIKKFDFKLA